MIRVVTAAIVLSLAAISAAQAQTKLDEETVHRIDDLIEIRGIGPAFCEKHGESLLAALGSS